MNQNSKILEYFICFSNLFLYVSNTLFPFLNYGFIKCDFIIQKYYLLPARFCSRTRINEGCLNLPTKATTLLFFSFFEENESTRGLSRFQREKKKGSQSGLRVASLHWYVKKRATQNTLQKKTHDYNPITKRKDKQQPNEYKHNHNRRKIDNNYLLKLLYRQCN